MSYKSKTIKKVIEEIDHNKIFLPALQRKFVWKKQQIQLLFDSLMRDYPIGTFLFWNLQCRTAEGYVFYEFLKEYDERTPYNRRKTGAFTHEEITGVLDGQQRLSSIYIGLMGTHCEKAPYKRTSNSSAYEKMSLYLNVLTLPYVLNEQGKIEMQEDRNYEFAFLTPERARQSIRREQIQEEGMPTVERQTPVYWLKVGDVLSWDDDPELDQLIDDMETNSPREEQKQAIRSQRRFIRRSLEILHTRVCKMPLLNYFEIAKNDLEDILKIFVRVNSNGTPLNKTDLLFSTIVATWDDGREQIEDLLKKINGKGDKFEFGNEYLMRCCLMLTDAQVMYKVNSFKAENVQKIQTNWAHIASAVEKTVDLLVEFGFSGNLLTSQMATSIIAYYIYKGGVLDKKSKDEIQKYLVHALLNRVFSSSTDQILTAMRNAMRTEVPAEIGFTYELKQQTFSFADLLTIQLPGRKSLAITESDVEVLLASRKGATSFQVLSLLYPYLRFQDQVFHQDHIHPFAGFTSAEFDAAGVAEDERPLWLECRDTLPNLQLLNGRLNESKSATPLVQWLAPKSSGEQVLFKQNNFFPEGIDLDFSHFMEFFEARKAILREKLHEVLTISNDRPTVETEDEVWESPELTEEAPLDVEKE